MGVPNLIRSARPKARTTPRPILTIPTCHWLFTDCRFALARIARTPSRIDMATTLASLLGINAPTHAVGRVLTEALAPTRHQENGAAGTESNAERAPR